MAEQIYLRGGPMDGQSVDSGKIRPLGGSEFVVEWFDPVPTPGLSPRQSRPGYWDLVYRRDEDGEATFVRKSRTL